MDHRIGLARREGDLRLRHTVMLAVTTAVTLVTCASFATANANAQVHAESHASIARPAANPAPVPSVSPYAGTPTQCPAGDFCVYSGNNGTRFCIGSASETDNLVSIGCSSNGTVFDNNGSGNGRNVAMNYGTNLTGAWTCIAAGHYWLFTGSYRYNHGGTGFGQDVSTRIGSFHFQTNLCSSNPPGN